MIITEEILVKKRDDGMVPVGELTDGQAFLHESEETLEHLKIKGPRGYTYLSGGSYYAFGEGFGISKSTKVFPVSASVVVTREEV